MVQFLLQTGYGDAALTAGVNRGDPALIQSGLDPNPTPNPNPNPTAGEEPFHLACWAGSQQSIDLLLKKGVNPHRGTLTLTLTLALALTTLSLFLTLTQTLIMWPSVAGDGDGWTGLHHAAMKGHVEVVRYLVEEVGVDPEVSHS